MLTKIDIENIYNAFYEEIPVFLAFSDPERLKIFLRIMQHGSKGISVTDVSAMSHLSRPAVSHHLKVLKDTGLISPKKVGTKIFYHVSSEDKFDRLKKNLAVMENGFAQMDLGELQEQSGELANMLDEAEK